MTLVSFWYRMICEIAVLLSAIIGSIWILSSLVLDTPVFQALHVSLAAAIAVGITGVIALVIAIIQKRKPSSWGTLLVIFSLSTSVLLSIASTGNLDSPYLVFWMMIALFAGLVGIRSALPVLAAVAAYGLYLWDVGNPSIETWVTFGLSFVLPVVIGYFIWARRLQGQDNSPSKVSALTQQLDNEANKSDIVISAIADGVIVVDTRGVIQLINPAAQRIIGWGEEDAVTLDYRSVLKIINSKNEIVDEQTDPIQKCLRMNEPVMNNDLGIRTVSGKQLLASILVSPLGTGGNGVIIVFRDTTAQHAEEREQAEFISTASHEMRTPVAAIEGYLGLALNPQTATIDDKARAYLAKAHEAAQHLGRLFQDLLDVSKAEDGRLNSKPTITDITAFTRTVLDDFAAQFNEKGLSLIFKPQTASISNQTISPLYYANVDLDHLREVLTNLVTNAIKYTKEGSVIVDVTGDDEHVYVSVKDTGLGIPAEDMSHLFQKFYRVDNTDTREIGGTGLGLYLARRLCEAMDGHLNVQSVYGEGSTFTVDVPRVKKEDALNAVNNPAQTEPAQPVVPTPAVPDPAASQPVVPTPPVVITAPQQATPTPLEAPQQPVVSTPQQAATQAPTEPVQQPIQPNGVDPNTQTVTKV